MSNKKSNAFTPVDAQAAAYIESINIAAEHGNRNLGHLPHQDIMETVFVLQQAAREKMMENHVTDRGNLVRAYGDPSAEYGTVNCATYDRSGNEIDIADESENGPVKVVLACAAFQLTINPVGTVTGFPWAVVHNTSTLFSSAQNEAIVYLNHPFRPGTCEVDFCLDEVIYWFEDGKVIASGQINQVHFADIVVTHDGLLIPVGAVRDPRHFRPFTPKSKVDAAKCRYVLGRIAQHGKDMKTHNKHWVAEPDQDSDRLLPDIAISFEDELADCIEQYIADQVSADELNSDLDSTGTKN